MPPWITLRLAAYALAALLLAGLLWRIQAWHKAALALPVAQAALKDSEAARASERVQWAAESARIATVSKGYLDELETLRTARVATPTRSVRLCGNPASVPAAEGPPAPATGGDATPAASGELPAETRRADSGGPDIGSRLYALADEADAAVASCRALRKYVDGLP